MKLFAPLFLFAVAAQAASPLPARPTAPEHPSSSVYTYNVKVDSFTSQGRKVDLFLPEGIPAGQKVPVILYGHGQAIGVDGYNSTLEHLARKGIAVVFPQFDTGFFDQDWRRMAADFESLSQAALAKYPQLDANALIYSGHSKGAYISLMAAGLSNKAKAILLFSPAGYDAQYLAQLDPMIPLTIVWGDRDNIIKRSAVDEIYNRAPSRYKQFIEVKSYSTTEPDLPADHFFMLNKSFFFGGRNGLSPLHYFGAWPWMIGAALDVQNGSRLDNPYLYGALASDTGLSDQKHIIKRSW